MALLAVELALTLLLLLAVVGLSLPAMLWLTLQAVTLLGARLGRPAGVAGVAVGRHTGSGSSAPRLGKWGMDGPCHTHGALSLHPLPSMPSLSLGMWTLTITHNPHGSHSCSLGLGSQNHQQTYTERMLLRSSHSACAKLRLRPATHLLPSCPSHVSIHGPASSAVIRCNSAPPAQAEAQAAVPQGVQGGFMAQTSSLPLPLLAASYLPCPMPYAVDSPCWLRPCRPRECSPKP